MAVRIVASTRIVGRAASIRRTQNKAASTMPSPSSRPASGQSADRSLSVIGPSMICRITSGKARPQNMATAAVIALPINAGRAGRANGSNRSNDLTGRTCAEAPGAGSLIAASGGLGLVAVELIVMAWPGYVRAPTVSTEFPVADARRPRCRFPKRSSALPFGRWSTAASHRSGHPSSPPQFSLGSDAVLSDAPVARGEQGQVWRCRPPPVAGRSRRHSGRSRSRTSGTRPAFRPPPARRGCRRRARCPIGPGI